MALGIYPLVGILILAELARLTLPALRRWEKADARNADALNTWVRLFALGAAAVQGAGITTALEDVKGLVSEPGISFRIACMLTLVAGTAFVIWLADIVTRHGVGSGVWVLFIAPTLAELPLRVGALADVVGQGAISAAAALAIAAFLVASVAAIVLLVQTGGATNEAAKCCLWPALLSFTLQPWLLITVALVWDGDGSIYTTWSQPGSAPQLLSIIALLGIFAFAYARLLTNGLAARVSALLTWGVLTMVAATNEVLAGHLQLPQVISAQRLVVITVVATIMRSSWGAATTSRISPRA